MKMLATGVEILGIKEYNLDGCRFLYRPSQNRTTIVTFSAFPPRDVAQKYNYIKDFIGQDCTFLAFLDTLLPNADPRGTYYLSNNLGNEYLLKMHCVIRLLSNSDENDIYLLGSSKGGGRSFVAWAKLQLYKYHCKCTSGIISRLHQNKIIGNTILYVGQ